MADFPESRRAKMLDVLRATGTLKVNDLARQLGVSVVTVRRDLTRLVDEGLVTRVHGGAMLTPVKGRKAPRRKVFGSVLGLVVPSLDYYWPEISNGVRAKADELGLRVVMRNTDYSAKKLRAHCDMLVAGGVAGLLLAPNVSDKDSLKLLDDLDADGVPVVLVERERELGAGRFIESVATDHEGAAMQAVHHLAELGHRSIGLFTHVGRTHVDEITAGWRRQIRTAGLDQRSPHWNLQSGLVESATQVLDELVSYQVSAIVVHADRDAIALVQHAQVRGIRVPEDLSVLAYDDEVAELFTPGLSAMRPPRASIGEAAVSLLAQRIVDAGRPRSRMRLSASLVLRESTSAHGPARFC